MTTWVKLGIRALFCLALLPAAFDEDFKSNGVRIHYTVQGGGDPVVLIHGLYSSARTNWELSGITAAPATSTA